MDVLFVCTGNICRSPMAAGLLRHHLDAVGVEIDVATAGFTLDDKIVDRKAVAAMARREIDISEHRSHIVTAEMIADAMLIISMVRRHSRDVVELVPKAFAKTFTLKELATRGRAVGPQLADESAMDWIARVNDGRSGNDLLGSSPETDIDDPLGRSARTFEATATEIDEHLTQVVGLWWPELALDRASN